MGVELPFTASVTVAKKDKETAHLWLANILTHFSAAEQAVGRLSQALDYPIRNGSLSNLPKVREYLKQNGDKSARTLELRIARWLANRPIRHLLAHGTINCLYDENGQAFIVTRHLPLDENDVTPDRVWTADECTLLLREVTKDSRSICDHIRNLLNDSKRMEALKGSPKPEPQKQSQPQKQAQPQKQSQPQKQAQPQKQSQPQKQAQPQKQSQPQKQAQPQKQPQPQKQSQPVKA